MKAKLEFDLPEEQQEFDLCCKAGKLHSHLWDLTQKIRAWRKYGHSFEDVDELLDELWEECIAHDLFIF